MVRAVARPSLPGGALSRLVLAAFMTVTGTLHFVVPHDYQRIVPRALPAGWARPLVYGSGAAEIAGAVLLLVPRTRRVGAVALAVLLAVVFPANVQMAIDGGLPGAGFPLGSPLAAWLRLPLQVPLILWALSHARRRDGEVGAAQ